MNLKDRHIIQKAFDITKENLILAQPPIIFMIVLSFTLAGLAMQTNPIAHTVFLVANVLLSCAFLSGWFFMIKQGLILNKRIELGEFKKPEERAEASMALGKAFFPGVGEYFLQMTFTVFAYVVLSVLIIILFYKLGLKILPAINVDIAQLYAAANSTPAEMQKFVMGLDLQQLKTLNLWFLYIGSVFTGLSFITMYLFPALIDSDPAKKEFFLFSPFYSFKRNILFICKNFLGSVGIMLFLFVLNTIFSILSIIFNLNIILSVIGLLISFYFMTYAVVLIFLYYEEGKK
jgi:hypothetical protein